MNDVTALKKERDELFDDLYHLRQPKRVPITIKVNNDFGIQYAGMDLIDTQWHPEKMEAAADAVCGDFFADKNPFGSRRFPTLYTLTDSLYFVMGSNGFMQHPEIEPMRSDEYADLIDNPYDFLVEKVIPRLYKGFDTDPFNKAFLFATALQASKDDNAKAGAIGKKMSDKYGYFNPTGKSSVFAPFDFLADLMRGFRGSLNDIRRYPQQVIEACEEFTPIMVKAGISKTPTVMSDCYVPLHMAPYMKNKDFEKFYWPSFKKCMESVMASGQGISFFCEQDWSRYIDYLAELPAGIRLRFEYGDPKKFKDKLGKKHIISGFYPFSLFATATVQQCLDEAKKLIDILAPGGNCSFDVDKVMATYNGGKENFIEVFNFVREYGKY